MKYQIVALYIVTLGAVLACSPTSINQQEGSLEKRIITANDELFHKGNLDLVDEIFSPQFVLHSQDGKTIVGPSVIKEYVTALRTAFPDLRVEIETLMEDGDMISWLRTHRGTFTSDLFDVKATGKVVEWQIIIVSRYKEGLIAEEWSVTNFVEAATRAK